MWKWWEPEEGGAGRGLGDECEAFLAGEWAEYRLARGQVVPPWAWLNRVAHAPANGLVLAIRIPSSARETDEWTRLRTCVVESLFRQAEENRMTVTELQRAALVPIELALFAADGPPRPNLELLVLILAALSHPSAQAGPR
jgi:hypothetical protein